MFGVGPGEILVLLLVALLVLGPERMPKLARDVGKTVNDLRRTSEELRSEFLDADRAAVAERLLGAATRPEPGGGPEAAATGADASTEGVPPSVPSDAGATQAEVTTEPAPTTDVEPPSETTFDREARLARERLEAEVPSAERDARALAEGWTVPKDEAGSEDRWG